MILLQGTIMLGILFTKIIQFLLFVAAPIVIIAKIIKSIKNKSVQKVATKDYLIILLKSLFYGIMVISIIGFMIYFFMMFLFADTE